MREASNVGPETFLSILRLRLKEWSGYGLIEHSLVQEDLSEVEFDLENCIMEPFPEIGDSFTGIRRVFTNNYLTFLGCSAGGDWEYPVYFIVYLDSKHKLRAYIPKNGNTWNYDTKQAFGNNQEADNKFLQKYCKSINQDMSDVFLGVDDGEILYDERAMKNDIIYEIKVF